MSRYRNICIALIFSVLLHFIIFYLSPFHLSAEIPEKKEVRVVFKIKKPVKKEVRPVSKKVKTQKPRRLARAEHIKVQPRKIIGKTLMAKANPVRVTERISKAVKQITKAERPLPPVTDSSEEDRFKFNDLVRSKIEKKKVYPEIARRMGIEGDVIVSFTIFPDGSVRDIEIPSAVKSHKLLKKAAETTIKKAAPYLPVPAYLIKEKGLRMEVKIAYKITWTRGGI